MSKLRNEIIKLAHDNPEMREDLLPLLQQAKVASTGTDLLNQRMSRAMREEQELIKAHWDACASDLKELFKTGMEREFRGNLKNFGVGVTANATVRDNRLHVTMTGQIFSARVPPDSEMNGWDFLNLVIESMHKVLPSNVVNQMDGELFSGGDSMKFNDLYDVHSEAQKMKLMPGEKSSFVFKVRMAEL